MSTEAMKLALEAIQDLRGYRPDIDKAIDAIRTAIQQAEAQQPATPERVPMTDEALWTAVIEHLGPEALSGGRMSILDAFHLGITVAEAHHGITAAPTASDA